MSVTAHLLQGLSSTTLLQKNSTDNETTVHQSLLAHEAASTIQQFVRRHVPTTTTERPTKRRRLVYSRAERAAVTAVWIQKLPFLTTNANNSMHWKYRWIRLWMRQVPFLETAEWCAVLHDTLLGHYNDTFELLAVCRSLVWDALCGMAASSNSSPTAVARLLHALVRRLGKVLVWSSRPHAMEGLLRASLKYPEYYASLVDPHRAEGWMDAPASSSGRKKQYIPGSTRGRLPSHHHLDGDDDEENEDNDDEDEDNDEEEEIVEESKLSHGDKVILPAAIRNSGTEERKELDRDDEEHQEEGHEDVEEEEADHEEVEDEEEDDDDEVDEGDGEDDDDDEEDDEVQSMESIEIHEDIPIVFNSQDTFNSNDAASRNIEMSNTQPNSATIEPSVAGTDAKNDRLTFFLRACQNVLRDGYDPRLTQHVMNAIKPPEKPINTRVLLRRAPTQEEFFRGSISRNPVSIHQIGSGGPDPTIGDLRQHIANELQMAESAELIEILVANKIIDVNLRLRVVNQVVWKEHLVNGGSNAVFSAGTISILWTADRRVTADTPLEALPPMVATYRLTGVDGEATENTVDHLDDPKEESTTDAAETARMKLVDPLVVLDNTRVAMTKLIQKARRDQVDGNFTIKDVPPGLELLKMCSGVHGPALLRAGAPTVLLKWLLNLLKISRETTKVSEVLQSLIEELSTLDIAKTSVSSESSDAAKQLPELLESIQSMDLPGALCGTVAKLLPFLTYGQPALSNELALHMKKHIVVDQLGQPNNPILMQTLIQTMTNLPRDEVICDALRNELLHVGFAEGLADCILRDMPSSPPPWTKVLWGKTDRPSTTTTADPTTPWSLYYNRAPALRVALEILNGLGKAPARLVLPCHWLEATSDSPTVETNGLGYLAETLLDTLLKSDIRSVITKVRSKTRLRKKEIALERRAKALANMNLGNVNAKQSSLSSFIPRVVGLFKESPTSSNKKRPIPDWMAEAANMKEETGLTCAVCHEGRTLQPRELLGLYAYVKKVSIPVDYGGSPLAISGIKLLQSLPPSLPPSCVDVQAFQTYFTEAKNAASNVSMPSQSSSRRSVAFTTTVSAGTGIHFTCHRKARSVDRSHPKAPKSEWEGAALRNNRVNCNVILPLVSKQSSSVPLRAVDSALSDHHASVSNLLGSTPKSTLWTVLHDVRLLLLRIAYGESLSEDCGGGSLTSNCQLIYHQLLTAEMFEKNEQADQPSVSAHVLGLPGAVVVSCLAVQEHSSLSLANAFVRDIAEASTMGSLCSIVFHHNSDSTEASAKKQWIVAKTFFLHSLLMLAGRRHAQGVNSSFCSSSRRNGEDNKAAATMFLTGKKLEQFSRSLRPMVTYFLMMDQLSKDFTTSMEDAMAPAERLASVITECRSATTVGELIQICSHESALSMFQSGMDSASA